MSIPPKSKYGGIAVDDTPRSKYGGVPVSDKKKVSETQSVQLDNGGATISQSQSNSISPFDLAGNVQANPNDAMLQAKRKGEENLAQQEATAADNLNEKINSTEFGKALNFGKKIPQVKLNDGTVVNINSLNTNVPFISPNTTIEKTAEELQNKVTGGFMNDDEINFLSTQKKESPALIKARISNVKEDIDVEKINDTNLKTDTNIKSVFENVKNKFGIEYNVDEDLSTQVNTAAYLEKLKLKGQELQKAQGEQTDIYGTRTFLKSETQLEEIGELNNSISAIENIGRQKELKRIAEKPFLTTGERLKLSAAVVGDSEYKQNVDAQKEREKEKKEGGLLAFFGVLPLIKKVGSLINGDGDLEQSNAILGEARLALSGAMNQKAQNDIALFNQGQKRVKDNVNNGIVLTKDVQELFEKQAKEIDDYSSQIETADKIYKEHPTLKKAAVTSLMNDVKAMQSGNIIGGTDSFDNAEYEIATGKITEADIKKYSGAITNLYGQNNVDRFDDGIRVLKYLESKGVDVNDKVVLDAIREDKTKEYYAAEPLAAAVFGVFSNTAKGIGDLTRFRDDLDRLSEKKVDRLNPQKVGKQDRYQLDKTTETLQTITQTTGQVLGQGALGFAAGGGLVASGISKIAASSMAGATVGFLSSYDNNYKDAYDLPDSTPRKRAAYATLLSAAEAGSERIFNEAKVFGEIPGVKQIFGEWAQKAGTEEFTQELQKELLGKAQNLVLQFSKGYVKNTGQEIVEEDVVSIFTSIAKVAFGDKDMNFAKAIEDLKETTYQTAVGMAGIGGVGAYRDMQSERNNTTSAQLYNAATYFDEAGDAINKGFKQGLYDEVEKNKKILILNTAVSKIEEIKNVENVLNRKLSLGEKESYVANATAQSVLNEQKKTASDDLIPIIDIKLDNLKKRQSEILNGEVKFEADGTILSTKPAAPSATPLAAAQENAEVANTITPEVEAIVQEAKDKRELGVFKNMPTIDLLQMVAQQAQDLDSKGNVQQSENAEQMRGMAMTSTVSQFGKELVDEAIKLYPAPVAAKEAAVATQPVQQTEFVPAPLKTSLTDAEKADAKKEIALDKKQVIPFRTAKKEGNEDAFLLKIANDKITVQNDADKLAFIPQNISQQNTTNNENDKSSQASNEKNGEQQNGQESGQNANGQNVQSQSQEVNQNDTAVSGTAVSTDFIAKETQFEALERLTKGIADLPVSEQKQEIENRAAAHEKSYQEFTKGENKISEENKKTQRVSEFSKLTANAMQKFLKNPADYQADKGDFENGSRKDENGVSISENDFVTLKEKVKELRKQKNTEEIAKLNAEPRAYLDGIVKRDWNKLSLQEKLALAKENLPEVDKMSDLDAAKVADKNAKILLQKRNGDTQTKTTTNENAKENSNGEILLEGVSETGNENQGGQDSEQLRQEKEVTAAVDSMDLDFATEESLPQKTVDAYNKKGKLLGQKSVARPAFLNKQNAMKENLVTLKKLVTCLIS